MKRSLSLSGSTHQHVHQLSPAGAYQPRKAQYFTPMQLEADVMHTVAGEVFRFQYHFALCGLFIRIGV